ncbi:hypothetical protein QQ020_15310 [Fulvivirgaceae bacterium BMA12]|uniref:Uncharacterized protein n=2 Tax=Agaribacillus aureus TaxID=3051825 RepID=A0ABT8L8W0_9BACT|nr:hypothetical protein [Fulvivirgaceae bacterium BMA12]
MFFTMGEEWKLAIREREVFTFQSQDTLLYHSVSLLSDTTGNPLLFFADLETPVCADGECKLANIKIYWNLLGNYVGYGTSPKFPLTKYEHDPFDHDDYARLHHLLLDDNSILRRKKISDLVDRVPAETYKPGFGKVDGMSGATKKEIKEAVVDGGLYSCYTLWHLVHGEVKKQMIAYLESIHSEALNHYFLYTPYEDYQAYALKQLDKENFSAHTQQIISIFKEGSPLIRTYILKKMPVSVLNDQGVTAQLFGIFPSLDVNTKTLLIKKMDTADATAAQLLAKHVTAMTKNQLRNYLGFLDDNPGCLTPSVTADLMEITRSREYAYNYLIKVFFDNKK